MAPTLTCRKAPFDTLLKPSHTHTPTRTHTHTPTRTHAHTHAHTHTRSYNSIGEPCHREVLAEEKTEKVEGEEGDEARNLGAGYQVYGFSKGLRV